jgi:GT2 family glycosyltransferase
MELSISIVSFNTRELLERTIRAAVADCEGLEAEVLVVDNASADGSAAMVHERFPSVRLIANAENRFFSAANNQALAMSRGRYVVVLNSDAEIQRGTLPAIVQYMNAHPGVGAVTARMFFPDGRGQRNCARFTPYGLLLLDHTFLGAIRRRRREELLAEIWYADWDRLSEREVDVVPGSFIVVRREAIETAGAFDERFRLYFVEDDWCWRIKRGGFKVMYLPVGGVIHPEGASVKQVRRLARQIYFEDMVRYVHKHLGRWRAWWLWALVWPTRCALALVGALRGE